MGPTRLTNNAGINLAVAVWLAHDDYDYQPEENYISATALLKPIRQIILGSRLDPEEHIPDVCDFIQARFGQALHAAIEISWKEHYAASLTRLGYPKRVIESIEINPETPDPGKIQVYTEIRTKRTIIVNGKTYVIGGQLDLCIEKRLQDVKKTSVWGYMNQKGISDEKWVLQGSIYRWLNPDKVTHDEMYIQYILLDWTKAGIKRDPNYPPHPLPYRTVPLKSVSETERWIHDRLQELAYYQDKPEEELPECSDEDLWRSDPVYKYYSDENASPGARSTKNFNSLSEALMHKNSKGKGRVDVVKGKVKACLYCPAAPLCGQRARLAAAGEIDE